MAPGESLKLRKNMKKIGKLSSALPLGRNRSTGGALPNSSIHGSENGDPTALNYSDEGGLQSQEQAFGDVPSNDYINEGGGPKNKTKANFKKVKQAVGAVRNVKFAQGAANANAAVRELRSSLGAHRHSPAQGAGQYGSNPFDNDGFDSSGHVVGGGGGVLGNNGSGT
eukprot:14749225-Ditylum_brightwellii.AAC.1